MDRDPLEMALSTDIVMDLILSHLKVRDLLSCRKVSKFWNQEASSVLRKRSTMTKNISREQGLMKLEERMEQSWDFPFSGLKFDRPWLLDSDRAREFFQNYGDRFTRLCLDTCWTRRIQLLAPFIQHLPRLSILEMGSSHSSPTPAELLNSTAEEVHSVLQLPSVRTIRVSSSCHDLNEDALCEVLMAASPSLQIECLDATPAILEVFKKAGKLEAVSFLKIHSDIHGYPNFTSDMLLCLSTATLSLTRLDFHVGGRALLAGLESILRSSHQTLKELHVDGECLSMYLWDEFPVFAKLTTLSCHVNICDQYWTLFRGSDGHNFPALKELKLDIKYKRKENLRSYLSTGSLTVPSLTTIDLDGYINELGMRRLAQSFPNVTEIRLEYGYYSRDFMPCGTDPLEMWNVGKFKHLEKLRIWNYIVRQPLHYLIKSYIGMDCFLTGFSAQTCDSLHKNKQLYLTNPPVDQPLRQDLNLLQLQNLKELLVCVVAGSTKLPDGFPFISMISIRYALEMMPNLRAKFVYERVWPPTSNYKRKKRVLEGVFKNVQPYIQLEPFFY